LLFRCRGRRLTSAVAQLGIVRPHHTRKNMKSFKIIGLVGLAITIALNLVALLMLKKAHFMNITIILSQIVILAGILLLFIVVPRIRTKRRVSALLAQHPGAEQTSVYLELHSTFPWGKQREIDAKVAEMKPQGWTYLQSSVASLSRTSRSWGGGLTLHFIRTKV